MVMTNFIIPKKEREVTKMKKEEILKKYDQEIRELDSKGGSLRLDIIFYPHFTKEELEKDSEAHIISRQFFNLKFVPEHDVYTPKNTMIYKNGKFKLIDGRHRILTFLVHCKYRELPCYLHKKEGGPSFEEKFKHLLRTPDDVKIFINDKNEYCIEIPTK